LPLMAAVFLGRGASAIVCRASLYHSLAEKFLPPPAVTESEPDVSTVVDAVAVVDPPPRP